MPEDKKAIQSEKLNVAQRERLNAAHSFLTRALWETWQSQRDIVGLDAVLFARLSVISTTQVGAVTAVDVGMTLDQFISICSANYKTALKKAPKFG